MTPENQDAIINLLKSISEKLSILVDYKKQEEKEKRDREKQGHFLPNEGRIDRPAPPVIIPGDSTKGK